MDVTCNFQKTVKIKSMIWSSIEKETTYENYDVYIMHQNQLWSIYWYAFKSHISCDPV